MDNLTAKVSCFARAYHYKNNSAHVFADPAAGPLLGPEYDQIARSMAQGIGFFLPGFHGSAEEGLRRIVDRQLSPSVLGRSAFCEGTLERQARQGCRQYVLLAAGYDTFAIRNRDAALRVFELDLPEVLADKRAKAERAGLESRAVDVPCDLSEASWGDALEAAGFERGLRSFASLLGISYYLEKGAFTGLLRTLGGLLSEGSGICLDYPTAEDSREARTNRALARGANEAMKARYADGEMEALLEESGFSIRERLGHLEMTRRWFSAYNRLCPERPMAAPEGVAYVHAVRRP